VNVKGRRLIIGSAVRPVDRLDRASGSAVDFADRASAGHRHPAGHPGRLADFAYRSGFDSATFQTPWIVRVLKTILPMAGTFLWQENRQGLMSFDIRL
jgi:hypothetical protein